MDLFPQRYERADRNTLPVLLALSLALHVLGFFLAAAFGHRAAELVAKLVPRPSPTPEIVALSDTITIEKRTVPREQHRTQPRPPAPHPRPRTVAQIPLRTAIAVPTLPPIETPRAAPSPPPQQPAPVATVPPPQQSSKSAFTPQQLAAMNAQFSRTIAQAERALTNVSKQRERPQNAMRPYAAIMAGTPEMFAAAAQGDCVPLQGPMPVGRWRAYYIRCLVRYPDGYFEQVSYPWVFVFPPSRDPFDYRVNPAGTLIFHGQGPPEGFVLAQDFALSRAVCTFFRARCQAVIDAERKRGDPAYGNPP